MLVSFLHTPSSLTHSHTHKLTHSFTTVLHSTVMAALRGAYVDGKGVRWDTNDADFEGFLSKKSKWVRGE